MYVSYRSWIISSWYGTNSSKSLKATLFMCTCRLLHVIAHAGFGMWLQTWCFDSPVGCEHGSYQSTTERTRVFDGQGVSERFPWCRPCPVGSYEDRVGSTGCTPCPEFHRTNSPGAKSVDECFSKQIQVKCCSNFICMGLLHLKTCYRWWSYILQNTIGNHSLCLINVDKSLSASY